MWELKQALSQDRSLNDDYSIPARLEAIESKLEELQIQEKTAQHNHHHHHDSSKQISLQDPLFIEIQTLKKAVSEQDATLTLLVEEGESSTPSVRREEFHTWTKKIEEGYTNEMSSIKEWCSQLEGSSWHAGNQETFFEMTSRISKLEFNLLQLSKGVSKQGSEESLVCKLQARIQTLEASQKQSQMQLQAQWKSMQNEWKSMQTSTQEACALQDMTLQNAQLEIKNLNQQVEGLHAIVCTQLRARATAEEMLQAHVSTITKQVASVTRQYVSVRISDNNRLLDATLRERIPIYAEKKDAFMLVRNTETCGNHDIPHGVVLKSLVP